MPSGHAQISVGVWGVLVSPLRSRAAWVAAGVLALAVSFSRLYLGVHFLSDVIAGLLLGLIFLLLFLRLEDPVVAWWQRCTLAAQVGLSALASGVMLGSGVLVSMLYTGWTAPKSWAYVSEIRPESMETLVAMSGSLLGMLIGASVMWRLGWFVTDGPLWMKVLRWLVGSLGVGLIWFGLKQVLPAGDTFLPSMLRYLRYALLTLWVQLGAPWMFLRIGLLRREVRDS